MADPTWEEPPPTYSDDESDIDTELPNTDDDSRRPDKNYVVLTEDDIKRLQNADIQTVSSVLTISPSEASLLLHHYRWQIEELQYEWFAESDSVRQKVGLLAGPTTTTTSCQTTTCGICFETIDYFCEQRDFLYTAGCDHPYCKDCWRGYISVAINESGLGCLALRCPDPECSAAVRRELVEEVAAREEVEKYSRFFVRSYVEGRREKVKWCVAPGCENAVEFELDGGSSFDVVCGCSHEFCWSCGEDAHRPVVCDTVRKWVAKNSSEAENTNWILAFTKACPKCKRPIEKNDGCNFMTCSPPCRFLTLYLGL